MNSLAAAALWVSIEIYTHVKVTETQGKFLTTLKHFRHITNVICLCYNILRVDASCTVSVGIKFSFREHHGSLLLRCGLQIERLGTCQGVNSCSSARQHANRMAALHQAVGIQSAPASTWLRMSLHAGGLLPVLACPVFC